MVENRGLYLGCTQRGSYSAKGRVSAFYQKNPRVRKIRVRNSGAGNGCANFMDTWKKYVLSAGKTMSVKFPFFGGVFGGGGGVPILFLWARGFF